MPNGTDGLPFVSVLVPMRNEERHIEVCLHSLAHQDYPRERFEVLVLAGASRAPPAPVAPAFLRQSVDALTTTDADGVGGPIESVGHGLIGEAIAIAMSSPFGVGNAHFRYSQEAQYPDTVPFPAYRRQIFDRSRPCAEDVNYGEDDEFHYR